MHRHGPIALLATSGIMGGNVHEVMEMQRYVEQLLKDIAYATENVNWPYQEQGLDVHDWISDDEEERVAPVLPLEEWTGIRKVELPPVDQLNDGQVQRLLDALKAMLDRLRVRLSPGISQFKLSRQMGCLFLGPDGQNVRVPSMLLGEERPYLVAVLHRVSPAVRSLPLGNVPARGR